MKESLYYLLLFLLTGCFSKKTYISEELRSFMPYKEDQELIFESNKGVTSVLTITQVKDNIFPDGIGAPNSEILVVDAHLEPDSVNKGRDVSILSLLAKYHDVEETIVFDLVLRGAGMRQRVPFSKIRNRELETLNTSYSSYTDILNLKFDYEFEIDDSRITHFYWSLSNGYVRLVQHDSTVWDLKPAGNH